MTATVRPPARHQLQAVHAALALWEHATKAGPSDTWDCYVIDRVIAHYARLGAPFSANSWRDIMPAVRTCLISRRLIVAQNAGLIERIGYTRSTLPSTHAALVAVYSAKDAA